MIARLRSGLTPAKIWSWLLTPADDLSTEHGRALERRRRATLAALMAMVAKAVSVATSLITVPITLGYLGSERYGMWIVLSSLVAMLSFTDLGIGNGLLNAVAAAYGRDDDNAIRRAISSSSAALCAIAVMVLAALGMAYPHLDWAALFNVRSALAVREAGPAVATFITCFAVAIPCNVVQRTQLALQRGFLASAWLCAGSLLTLPAVLLAVHLRAGLPVLVAVLMGAPLIAALANSLWFFGRQQPRLRPALAQVHRTDIVATVRSGGLFLFIQLGNSVVAGSVPLLIAHGIRPSAIPQYAVPERLLAVVVMLASMYVQPLWPAFREALSRGDHHWIIVTYRKTLVRVASACGLTLAVLSIAMPTLLRFWIGDSVQPPTMLVTGLCVYKSIECLLWLNAMLLNGLQVILGQVLMAMGTALVFLPVIYAVSKTGDIALVPWAAALVVGSCNLIIGLLLIRRRLRALTDGA